MHNLDALWCRSLFDHDPLLAILALEPNTQSPMLGLRSHSLPATPAIEFDAASSDSESQPEERATAAAAIAAATVIASTVVDDDSSTEAMLQPPATAATASSADVEDAPPPTGTAAAAPVATTVTPAFLAQYPPANLVFDEEVLVQLTRELLLKLIVPEQPSAKNIPWKKKGQPAWWPKNVDGLVSAMQLLALLLHALVIIASWVPLGPFPPTPIRDLLGAEI
jgi:hypothetical protein